ncbi:MAG: hypothetical protein HYT85_14260 [candidate division NC10 bacterium]|nr:hypothetical protein [candidate division NC10 bacterium]
MTRVTRIAYGGWPNCCHVSNGLVELIVTTDVGPRLIWFGFPSENELAEFPADLGRTGGDEFRLYGGHRLWHAPESKERTYCPDNSPVTLEPGTDGVRVIQPTETTTRIQKEMEISLSPDQPHLRILHRLRNHNLWAVELSAWALTAMAPGGTAVLPLPPRGPHPEHLLPSSTLTLWPYTDLSDPRLTWGRRHVLLRQDPSRPAPLKIGASVPDGWAAYARNDHLFTKTFRHVPGATYPDFGSSCETYTDGDMLELETLGPLTHVEPGGMVEHVESWFLWKGVPVPSADDDVEGTILPKVRQVLS